MSQLKKNITIDNKNSQKEKAKITNILAFSFISRQ